MSAPLSEQPAEPVVTDQEPDSAPPADAPSDSEPGLGDPGKKALDAERKRANAAEKANKDLLKRIGDLENAALSADEKALKEAVDTARAEATAATQALLLPRLQLSDIRGIAATVPDIHLDAEQLEGWLAGIDPKRFVGDDGEVDKDKVMGSLTAMFGRSRQASPVRQWGQYTQQTPATGQPGSAGRAEAQRRFNKK